MLLSIQRLISQFDSYLKLSSSIELLHLLSHIWQFLSWCFVTNDPRMVEELLSIEPLCRVFGKERSD